MNMCEFERGSISFRAKRKSVAFVVVKYGCKNVTVKSVLYDDLEASAEDVRALLGRYRGALERWDKYLKVKLPYILRRQQELERKLNYEDIAKALDDIVWSIELHKLDDKSGSRGGRELADKIWKAWQSIRPVISSTTYWGVKEDDALVRLGLKDGRIQKSNKA